MTASTEVDGLRLEVESLRVVCDGTTEAIHHVDVVIEPGEYVGIAGPNGSGKSTFGSALLGLCGGVLEVSGAVRYNGFDIYGDGVKERERTALRARHFGYVPKQASFDPDLSVEGNIVRPHLLAGHRLDAGHVKQLAKTFGLSSLLDQPLRSLSSGFQQRVNIVRGLANQPDVALLDEPTEALDPSQKARLIQELRSYARRSASTVIVISHEDTGADRIINFVSGKVLPPAPTQDQATKRWGRK
ncbi:MAG: ATP-binding cassette domain-containing protein [Propionibacteriales bacterium]|nr:ATP-binding cassette domain-containing protein [Propionibacteriales bacterium]